MPARVYTNPVYPHYFADPFVWRVADEYYAIGTGGEEAAGRVESAAAPSVFPLLRSDDLVHWRDAGRALVRPDPAHGDTFWAPEVAYADGRWHLYYSVGHDDRLHQLRVAVSEHAGGPYRDLCALTDLRECSFAIDPHPFRDDDGAWYLFHARDFLDDRDEQGRRVRPGTALVVHRLTTMTQLSREGRTVARARHEWQRFAADRPMYGRRYDWHTLEGPSVLKHANRYYCFYSGGCWQTATYGVDYVVADAVLGEYSDEGAQNGPRILQTIPACAVGPGHCSIVRAADASHAYVVYHAWGADMKARRMCIDHLWFSTHGPRSNGPTWTEQSL